MWRCQKRILAPLYQRRDFENLSLWSATPSLPLRVQYRAGFHMNLVAVKRGEVSREWVRMKISLLASGVQAEMRENLCEFVAAFLFQLIHYLLVYGSSLFHHYGNRISQRSKRDGDQFASELF
jgi:hypothetical protein